MDINLSPFTGLDYRLDNSFIAFNLLPQYYRHLVNYRMVQTVANGSQLFWDNKFLPERFDFSQQLNITGQTIVLEAYLNEIFDFTERRIEIINAQTLLNPIFIYKNGEEGNVGNLGNFIYNKDELTDFDVQNSYLYKKKEVVLDYDFEVKVPNELITLGLDINNLKSIVDKYKTVGTIYNVVYI